MSGANIIQANYDDLDSIATRFGEQAEASIALYNKVQHSFQALEDGGWIGQGAQQFFQEMNGEIFPALQRFTQALEAAREVTLQVKLVWQEAEAEAASVFAGGAVAGSVGGAGDGGVAGGEGIFGTPTGGLIGSVAGGIVGGLPGAIIGGYIGSGQPLPPLPSEVSPTVSGLQSGLGYLAKVENIKGASTLKGLAGSLQIAGYALDIYEVGHAWITGGDPGKEAAGVGGSMLGGWAGAKAGAATGAFFGSFLGPVGTVVGGVAGAIVGGFGGSLGGEQLGERIYGAVTGWFD